MMPWDLKRDDLDITGLARLFSRSISVLYDAVRWCACGRGCPSSRETCPECGRPSWCTR